MKVLVSGSRHIDCGSLKIIWDRLDKLDKKDLVIIQGDARGVDSMAKAWAERNNIPHKDYPACWVKHGKVAGPIRNREMLKENPDLVIAFPCSKSVGTRDMISAAKKAGFTVEVIELNETTTA